jgi:hypothetical protein
VGSPTSPLANHPAHKKVVKILSELLDFARAMQRYRVERLSAAFSLTLPHRHRYFSVQNASAFYQRLRSSLCLSETPAFGIGSVLLRSESQGKGAVAVGLDVGLDSDQCGGMLSPVSETHSIVGFCVAELRSAWTAGGGCPHVAAGWSTGFGRQLMIRWCANIAPLRGAEIDE